MKNVIAALALVIALSVDAGAQQMEPAAKQLSHDQRAHNLFQVQVWSEAHQSEFNRLLSTSGGRMAVFPRARSGSAICQKQVSGLRVITSRLQQNPDYRNRMLNEQYMIDLMSDARRADACRPVINEIQHLITVRTQLVADYADECVPRTWEWDRPSCLRNAYAGAAVLYVRFMNETATQCQISYILRNGGGSQRLDARIALDRRFGGEVSPRGCNSGSRWPHFDRLP